MASEGNPAQNSTSSPAPSTSQEPQAPPWEESEDQRCPICLDPIIETSSGWCRHNFCFLCILNWSRVRAVCPICQEPLGLLYRKVGDNDYAVYRFVRYRPTNHAQAGRRQHRSATRRRHHPSVHHHHHSASRDQGSGRAGTPGRTQSRSPRRHRGGHSNARSRSPRRHRGGHSNARSRSPRRRHGDHSNAQSRSPRRHHGGHSNARSRSPRRRHGDHSNAQSRSPRRHHGGHSAASHAQLYNPSSHRRWQQSRAQDTAQVTGAEEGQSPRPGWNVPPSSRRTERRQRGHWLSTRERQPTRSRSPLRSRSRFRSRSRRTGRQSQQEQQRSRDHC